MDDKPVRGPTDGQDSVEGPAFTPGVKVLASLLMLALAGYGASTAQVMLIQPWSATAALLMALALGCLVVCYVWMMCSRTTVSATHIRQSWIRPKRVALADITQIKLIYIPALAWLIAPRLIVRTRSPGSIVFHAGDSLVLNALVQLTLHQRPPH